MKKEFVTSWNRSSQPRKQRKYLYSAPLHLRSTFLSVNLSKELRKKIGARNLRVRKGDKIKVLRGQHKGKSGKVERVSLHRMRVFVAGIDRTRKDGTKNLIPLPPSNLQIIEMEKTEKKRIEDTHGQKSP